MVNQISKLIRTEKFKIGIIVGFIFLAAPFCLAVDDPSEDFIEAELNATDPMSAPTSNVSNSSDTSAGDSLIGELEGNTDPTAPITSAFENPDEGFVDGNSNGNLSSEGFGGVESLSVDQATKSSGAVIVEQKSDLTLPYKQRRSRHGVLFSFLYEQFYPTDYFSLYNDVYVEDIIGEDRIPLMGGELGYKFNFTLGSIALLASYSRGFVEKTVAADERSLGVARTAVSANFALDNFLQEPWIVPYGQVGLHQFSVIEDNLTEAESKSDITSWSMNYRLGLLFQLNWIESAIDSNTHKDGLRSSGLQNTFLDIYMAEHLASADARDPSDPFSEGDSDMASSQEIGVGLKMEF